MPMTGVESENSWREMERVLGTGGLDNVSHDSSPPRRRPLGEDQRIEIDGSSCCSSTALASAASRVANCWLTPTISLLFAWTVK
jgi:hypothetical protein